MMGFEKFDRIRTNNLWNECRKKLHNPRAFMPYTGTIIGFCVDQECVRVIKDGTEWPRTINKRFIELDVVRK